MTPEQLEREQRLRAATDELKALMSSVPRAVIDGGATRAIAWKTATLKAQKTLARGTKDPSKLREHLLDLQCCVGSNPAELAKVAYGA